MSGSFNIGDKKDGFSIDFHKLKSGIKLEELNLADDALKKLFKQIAGDDETLDREDIEKLQNYLAGTEDAPGVDKNNDGNITKNEARKANTFGETAQKLGKEGQEQLFKLLGALQNMTTGIDRVISGKNDKNNKENDVLETVYYSDGREEIVYKNGQREVITEKDGFKTTTYYDETGTPTQIIEIDANGNKTTKNGEGVLVKRELKNGAFVEDYENGELKTITQTGSNGQTQIQTFNNDNTYTITRKNDEVEEEIIYLKKELTKENSESYAPEERTELQSTTITQKDGQELKTVITHDDTKGDITEKFVDGKIVSQTIGSRTVEYEQEGEQIYTKGIIVQNAETIDDLSKKFGVSKQAIIDENPGLVKKSGGTYWFKVGTSIVIPRKVAADDSVWEDRLTAKEAIAKFNADWKRNHPDPVPPVNPADGSIENEEDEESLNQWNKENKQRYAIGFLTDQLWEATNSIESYDKNNRGVVAEFCNAVRECFTPLGAKNTRLQANQQIESRKEQLKKLNNAVGTDNFETTFRDVLGVDYNEKNIKDCQTNCKKYVQAEQYYQQVKSMQNQLRSHVVAQGMNSGAKVQVDTKATAQDIGKVFEELGFVDNNGKPDLNKMNALIKQIEKDNPNSEAWKYGKNLYIGKGRDGRYFLGTNKGTALNCHETLIVDKLCELLNDAAIKQITGEEQKMPANKKDAFLQKTINGYKDDYMKSLKTAYGTDIDINMLAEKYIQREQQAVSNLNLGFNIGLMALSLIPGVGEAGWAAKAAITTALITNPIDFAEKATSGNGLDAEELNEWFTSCAINGAFLITGGLTSVIGEGATAVSAEAMLKTSSACKNLSPKQIAELIKDPNLNPQIARSLTRISKASEAFGFTTKAAMNICLAGGFSYAETGEFFTESTIMAIVMEIAGGALMNNGSGFRALSKKGQCSALQKMFKEHYGVEMTPEQANRIIEQATTLRRQMDIQEGIAEPTPAPKQTEAPVLDKVSHNPTAQDGVAPAGAVKGKVNTNKAQAMKNEIEAAIANPDTTPERLAELRKKADALGVENNKLRQELQGKLDDAASKMSPEQHAQYNAKKSSDLKAQVDRLLAKEGGTYGETETRLFLEHLDELNTPQEIEAFTKILHDKTHTGEMPNAGSKSDGSSNTYRDNKGLCSMKESDYNAVIEKANAKIENIKRTSAQAERNISQKQQNAIERLSQTKDGQPKGITDADLNEIVDYIQSETNPKELDKVSQALNKNNKIDSRHRQKIKDSIKARKEEPSNKPAQPKPVNETKPEQKPAPAEKPAEKVAEKPPVDEGKPAEQPKAVNSEPKSQGNKSTKAYSEMSETELIAAHNELLDVIKNETSVAANQENFRIMRDELLPELKKHGYDIDFKDNYKLVSKSGEKVANPAPAEKPAEKVAEKPPVDERKPAEQPKAEQKPATAEIEISEKPYDKMTPEELEAEFKKLSEQYDPNNFGKNYKIEQQKRKIYDELFNRDMKLDENGHAVSRKPVEKVADPAPAEKPAEPKAEQKPEADKSTAEKQVEKPAGSESEVVAEPNPAEKEAPAANEKSVTEPTANTSKKGYGDMTPDELHASYLELSAEIKTGNLTKQQRAQYINEIKEIKSNLKNLGWEIGADNELHLTREAKKAQRQTERTEKREQKQTEQAQEKQMTPEEAAQKRAAKLDEIKTKYGQNVANLYQKAETMISNVKDRISHNAVARWIKKTFKGEDELRKGLLQKLNDWWKKHIDINFHTENSWRSKTFKESDAYRFAKSNSNMNSDAIHNKLTSDGYTMRSQSNTDGIETRTYEKNGYRETYMFDNGKLISKSRAKVEANGNGKVLSEITVDYETGKITLDENGVTVNRTFETSKPSETANHAPVGETTGNPSSNQSSKVTPEKVQISLENGSGEVAHNELVIGLGRSIIGKPASGYEEFAPGMFIGKLTKDGNVYTDITIAETHLGGNSNSGGRSGSGVHIVLEGDYTPAQAKAIAKKAIESGAAKKAYQSPKDANFSQNLSQEISDYINSSSFKEPQFRLTGDGMPEKYDIYNYKAGKHDSNINAFGQETKDFGARSTTGIATEIKAPEGWNNTDIVFTYDAGSNCTHLFMPNKNGSSHSYYVYEFEGKIPETVQRKFKANIQETPDYKNYGGAMQGIDIIGRLNTAIEAYRANRFGI